MRTWKRVAAVVLAIVLAFCGGLAAGTAGADSYTGDVEATLYINGGSYIESFGTVYEVTDKGTGVMYLIIVSDEGDVAITPRYASDREVLATGVIE